MDRAIVAHTMEKMYPADNVLSAESAKFSGYLRLLSHQTVILYQMVAEGAPVLESKWRPPPCIITGPLALVQAQCILLKTINTVPKQNCVLGVFITDSW